MTYTRSAAAFHYEDGYNLSCPGIVTTVLHEDRPKSLI